MNKKIKRFMSVSALLKLFLITGITTASTVIATREGNTNISVVNMTNDTFKQLIFNYDKNKEWKYEGSKPAIIDFYATWCPPCRQLSPLVEEIAKEYSGKIIVYKIDTDKEKILSQRLGITNLPTLLFIPLSGKPQASMGYIPKETIVKTINNVLMIK